MAYLSYHDGDALWQATSAYVAGGPSASTAAFYFLGGDENTLTVLDAMLVTVALDLDAPGPSNMSFVPQVRPPAPCLPLGMLPRQGLAYTPFTPRCRMCPVSRSRRSMWTAGPGSSTQCRRVSAAGGFNGQYPLPGLRMSFRPQVSWVRPTTRSSRWTLRRVPPRPSGSPSYRRAARRWRRGMAAQSMGTPSIPALGLPALCCRCVRVNSFAGDRLLVY